MAEFIKAYEKTALNEGGHVMHPNDPGGETYKGISRRYHRGWPGWTLVDAHKGSPDFPGCLGQDAMLRDMVGRFYKQEYWDRLRLDEVDSQLVAEEIFDTAVNIPLAAEAKYLQRVLNVFTGAGLKVDGLIGPKTIGVLNDFLKSRPEAEEVVFEALDCLQGVRYIEAVEDNPKKRDFVVGWFAHRIGRKKP